MADPDSYKKDFQKQLQYRASARRDTLDPMTDSNYQHAMEKMAFLRRQSFPLIPSQTGRPSASSAKHTHILGCLKRTSFLFTCS